MHMVVFYSEAANMSCMQGLGGALCLWMDVLAPDFVPPFPGYEV